MTTVSEFNFDRQTGKAYVEYDNGTGVEKDLAHALTGKLNISTGTAALDDVSKIILAGSGVAPSQRVRIATKHACATGFGAPLSNGSTQLSGTDRISFDLNADVKNLRFLFRNFQVDGPYMQVTPIGNAVKFYACLEVNANNTPISFPTNLGTSISAGGRTATAVSDGGYTLSEPISTGVVAKGSTMFYRVHKVVSAGEKWLLNGDTNHATHRVDNSNTRTTDIVYGTTVVDGSNQTTSFANQAWGAFTANSKYMAATAIIGEQVTPTPVCLIVGDSIAQGMNSKNGQGYIGEALDSANIGYQNAGCNSLACNYAAKTGAGVISTLSQYADHILAHCLTNDIYVTNEVTTLAQAKVSILNYAKLHSCPTNKIWFATLLPRNSSSDNFMTYANQIISDTAKEALRIEINNWIRDTSTSGMTSYLNLNLRYKNCAGFFDPASLIERNSDGSPISLINGQQGLGTGGRWPVNGTANAYTEGIHPSSLSTSIIKACVPTAQLTLDGLVA